MYTRFMPKCGKIALLRVGLRYFALFHKRFMLFRERCALLREIFAFARKSIELLRANLKVFLKVLCFTRNIRSIANVST